MKNANKIRKALIEISLGCNLTGFGMYCYDGVMEPFYFICAAIFSILIFIAHCYSTN